MSTNYSKIKDILLHFESLEIPDWACACIGENFNMGSWLTAGRKTGLSWEYPVDPSDLSLGMMEVVTMPPENDPGYRYDGSPGQPDKRRFFLVSQNEPAPREISRDKLWCHTINFRELAKAVVRALGMDNRNLTKTPLITDKLIKLTPLPLPIYLAFAFTWREVRDCIEAIRKEVPSSRVIMIIVGERWGSQANLDTLYRNYDCKAIGLFTIMRPSTNGFVLNKGYSLKRLVEQQMPSKLCPSLSQDVSWEDIEIIISQQYISYYQRTPLNGLTPLRKEFYQDVKEFWYAKEGRELPALKYLRLMARYPDSSCLPEDELKRNPYVKDARKKLTKHLKLLFPDLARESPFKTSRKEEKPQVHRRFHIRNDESELTRRHPKII